MEKMARRPLAVRSCKSEAAGASAQGTAMVVAVPGCPEAPGVGTPRAPGEGERSMRRVVVTGLGVVAPNGIGKEAFWSACLNGKSGVGPIRTFDASSHPVKIAAEVQDFDVTPFIPASQRKSMKIMSRAMRFAVGAAGLSIQDSGLDFDREDPTRI